MDLSSDNLLLGLAWFVVFLFSTTLHEAGHAWAALKLGDPTAYSGGQVSLNPIPHVRREPFGMVLVPILSFLFGGWMFGWASAPYSPGWALTYPRRAAAMAAAGPAGNLILLVAAGLGIRAGLAAGYFYPPESITFTQVVAPTEAAGAAGLAAVVSILFTLNLLLFIFNLLPVPPLDGSAMLQAVMSRDLARRYQAALWSQPMLAWIGIIAAWRIFPYIFGPAFTLALNLLYPDVRYG